MIPARLIRCIPEHPPEWAEEWWGRWKALHTGWQFVTYRDPLDPGCFPRLGRWFGSCSSGAQLAGLVRLEAVWELGGVYVDMDMEPLRPINRLLAGSAFIGTEDGVHLTDAMFGAEARHPGIGECITRVDRLFADALERGDPPPGAQATGPLNTTAVLTGRPDVTVLPTPVLYPYSYLERHRRHEDFHATTPEALAVHHWAFTWNGT